MKQDVQHTQPLDFRFLDVTVRDFKNRATDPNDIELLLTISDALSLREYHNHFPENDVLDLSICSWNTEHRLTIKSFDSDSFEAPQLERLREDSQVRKIKVDRNSPEFKLEDWRVE